MSGGKQKLQNRLWLARTRRDLKQKHVAYLLGQNNLDQVSRYENGLRLPTLKTALKLEIILGLPGRALFPELHAQLRSEIRERASSRRSLREKLEHLLVDEHCSYEDSLTDGNVTKTVRDKIHHHAAFLINTLNHMPSDSTTEGDESE